MKQLIIIRGVQGSGKTTIAEDLLYSGNSGCYDHDLPWVHVEADMFFVDPITYEYKFDGTKIGQAHRWCEHKVHSNMEDGKNIIVSNTFVKKKEMQPYIEMAEQHGYTVQEIICRGRFANTHGVPEEKVEGKRQAFEY